MYGGGTTFDGAGADTLASEDPVRLQAFEARIERGEKIEPTDWMPALYRRQLIRMIEQRPDGYYFRSGGGITYRSVAEQEYQEVLDKVYVPV